MDRFSGNPGAPVIFVSDWFITAREDWRGQIGFFTSRFNCCFFTLSGHESAPTDDSDVGTSMLKANLNRLEILLKRHRDRSLLVAHGMGALPSLMLADENRDRIAAIVLIAPRISATDSARKTGIPLHMSHLLLRLSVLWRDPLGEKGWSERKKRLKTLHPARARRYIEEWKEIDLLPLLYRLEIPVLIIVGEQDPVSRVVDSETLNEILPLSRLIRYGHLGHSPQREEPETINQTMFDFLEAQESRWKRSLRNLRAWIRRFVN